MLAYLKPFSKTDVLESIVLSLDIYFWTTKFDSNELGLKIITITLVALIENSNLTTSFRVQQVLMQSNMTIIYIVN